MNYILQDSETTLRLNSPAQSTIGKVTNNNEIMIEAHDQAFLLPIHFWLVFESVEGLALLVF